MNRVVPNAAQTSAPTSAFKPLANAISVQKATLSASSYDYMDVNDEEWPKEQSQENSDSESFEPNLQELNGRVGALESDASSNAVQAPVPVLVPVPVSIPPLPQWNQKPPPIALKPQALLPLSSRSQLVSPKPPSPPLSQGPSTPPTPGALKYSSLQVP